MPRRKRGRDKPKDGVKRNRKQDIFILNTRDIDAQYPNLPGRSWVQNRRPFAEDRELGETVGFYNVDGRIYLGRPGDRKTGIAL